MDSSVLVTLVRHGESESNRVKRWQGQGDSPLSELGREQAARLALRLSDEEVDVVVCSDLSRAADTALALGRPMERRPEFREFDVGRWEGLTREEVQARYPEELRRLMSGEDIPLGGGESYRSFAGRVERAFARFRGELRPGQHALIVCHGGVIGALLSGFLGLRGQNRFPLASVANTSITQLRLGPEGVELRVFNDVLHLRTLGTFPILDGGIGTLGLVADEHPDQSFGVFAEHYETRAHAPGNPAAGDPLPEGDPEQLRTLLATLSQRHSAQRVSVSASASIIHGFVGELIGAAPGKARLAAPSSGALSHVVLGPQHTYLLDYGVLPEAP